MRVGPRGLKLMHAPPARFLEWPPVHPGPETRLALWVADFARRPENRGALHHWEVLPARPVVA